MPQRGTLFVVGTPIGNPDDLGDRARRVLSQVDLVAAEDTRRAGVLLKRIGARARFLSFYDANERDRIPQVLATLEEGADVALVSDAGMPGVSDPGYRLVAACAEAGITVDVVPGPSAALAALVASGLPTDRFAFEGFLPRSGGARRERVAAIAGEPRTVVLFESPRRTVRTLADLADACGGDRRAAVCRELTKVHQEVLRGSLAELVAALGDRDVKGEVTIVVEGAPDGGDVDAGAAVARARELVAGGMRKRDAAKEAAAASGVPANDIYGALTGGSTPGDPGTRSSD